MAYNYFGTGSQLIGDIIAVVDPQLNTKIDFENDSITLVTSGSNVASVGINSVNISGNVTITPPTSNSNTAIHISGSATVGGATYIDFIKATNNSAGAITPSKTFRLNNSGSFEIVNNAYNATIYTLDDTGSISVVGTSKIGSVTERISTSAAATGVTTFDTSNSNIFYVNGPSGDITANFTNVPVSTNTVITTTVLFQQGATARTISALQINSTSSTIKWANNVTPTVNNSKYDLFGFSLIYSGSTWVTLGQMSTYG